MGCKGWGHTTEVLVEGCKVLSVLCLDGITCFAAGEERSIVAHSAALLQVNIKQSQSKPAYMWRSVSVIAKCLNSCSLRCSEPFLALTCSPRKWKQTISKNLVWYPDPSCMGGAEKRSMYKEKSGE